MTTRTPALRKLLAVGALYRDEIFLAMGGDRMPVVQAIKELERGGELVPGSDSCIRRRYELKPAAREHAFTGGAHA